MNVKTVLISKNRQLAIPASFGIEPGERVKIYLDSDTGVVTIKKLPNPVEALFGIAKHLKYSSKEFLEEKKSRNKKRVKKLA